MTRRAPRNLLRTAAVLIATATVATTVHAGTAAAIDWVHCNSTEYVKIRIHGTAGASWACFANSGSMKIKDPVQGDKAWITSIWTGNNRVQWYGDSKWQPAQPIAKNTTFTFPHHPGGVRIDQLWIAP
jgi:hypothetical protein